MKKTIIPLAITLLLVQLASAKMTRLKHAHNHGAASLGLAFDDKSGKVDFKVSSDAILGFEYEPKSEKEKKFEATQFALLENKIGEMIVFAPDLGCNFKKEKIQREKELSTGKKPKTEHSDLLAVFTIACNKSPVGSTVTFNIQKFFPAIHDVDAVIIAEDMQKSLEIKKNGVSVELSK